MGSRCAASLSTWAPPPAEWVSRPPSGRARPGPDVRADPGGRAGAGQHPALIVGILLVSSEWSQRTAMITFVLVPHRSRVFAAKLIATVALSVVALVSCIAVAALGTAFAASGVDGAWSLPPGMLGQVAVSIATGMITGVAFGAALLASAPAIVLYFALPTALGAPRLDPGARGRRAVAGRDALARPPHRPPDERHRVGARGHDARDMDAAAPARRPVADHAQRRPLSSPLRGERLDQDPAA
jgi:hypothetical protein